MGYSGEGVWVKVRWHWIAHRAKCRVVTACNAVSVRFSIIKMEDDKEAFLKEHACLLLSYGGELMCLRHGSGHSSLR